MSGVSGDVFHDESRQENDRGKAIILSYRGGNEKD